MVEISTIFNWHNMRWKNVFAYIRRAILKLQFRLAAWRFLHRKHSRSEFAYRDLKANSIGSHNSVIYLSIYAQFAQSPRCEKAITET